jgi:cyclopropane fatty-acyl-phospholipid synthase-like methyltransferase
MSISVQENSERVVRHYREFWKLHGRESTPPPLAVDGRPPIMNIGYWGDGAVTAREAQVTFVRLLADRLPDLEDRRVLDIGCGVGGPASVLAADYGARVDALNIVPEQVQLARRYAKAQGLADQVTFHEANAMAIPFGDATFDAVFSLEAAHCFIDKPRFLAETLRVLRPGGRIAFSDMTATVDLPLARRLPALGLDLVTAAAWQQMFGATGFEVMEHRLVGAGVYPGYRRWLMLTAAQRRRTIRDALAADGGTTWPPSVRHAQAWLLEFAANRSVSAMTSAMHLREYVLTVARRPPP